MKGPTWTRLPTGLRRKVTGRGRILSRTEDRQGGGRDGIVIVTPRGARDPHAESEGASDEGFAAFADARPAEDVSEPVAIHAGTAVRWIPGRGWETEAE